jgi:membrane protease YdiL (CAAX protease family)
VKRVFAFPLVRLILIVLLFGALAGPLVLFFHPPRTPGWSIATTWMLAGLLLASTIVVERFAGGKTIRAIGLNPDHAWRDFALGVLMGGTLFSLVVLELAVVGSYRVASIHVTPALAIGALLLLADAALEELLFRGVLFRLIEEWAGTWIALAVSAVIFGLAHAANPSATWVSSLAIALEAGVLLGAAFVVTRNLWLPIGLHFAWNFFEGPVFGTQISGHRLVTSAVTAHVSGPNIVTGGSFGPEAGLCAIVTCLIAAIALLLYRQRAVS